MGLIGGGESSDGYVDLRAILVLIGQWGRHGGALVVVQGQRAVGNRSVGRTGRPGKLWRRSGFSRWNEGDDECRRRCHSQGTFEDSGHGASIACAYWENTGPRTTTGVGLGPLGGGVRGPIF